MSPMSTACMSRLVRLFVLPLVGLVAITGALGAAAAPEPEDDPGSPVLVLPGPDAGSLDETDRATALIGLSTSDTAVLDETDRATALIDLSTEALGAQTQNQRSITMSEDKLAPGGRLATWEDVEASAGAVFTPRPGGQPY